MITSLSNPRIRQVAQWQSKARERKKAGIFIAEGLKMYEEAPASWLRETYITEGLLRKLGADSSPFGTALYHKVKECGYEEVTEEIFARISDTQTPQGILCVLQRPDYSMQELLKMKNPVLVVLESLQDPGNLGTIVRTAEGAGVHGIILAKDTVDIFNPKTIRATMGSIYRVPFVFADSVPEVLAVLKKAGVRTYAAHLEGSEYYDSFDFTEGTAFLIGNEGNGLSRETAQAADAYLKIPMEGSVESLNAAIATSLLMYEAHRQRAKARR